VGYLYELNEEERNICLERALALVRSTLVSVSFVHIVFPAQSFREK